jgi:hypothetical protein
MNAVKAERMHARRIAVSTAAAVAVGCSVFASSASALSVPAKCPTPASIDAAAGTTLKFTQNEGSKTMLVCSYTNGKSATVVIASGILKGVTASEFVAVVGAEAKKAHLTKVSGLGTVAYEFTSNDAKTNADHVASTGIFCLIGNEEFDVLGSLPAKNIIAIAKKTVG